MEDDSHRQATEMNETKPTQAVKIFDKRVRLLRTFITFAKGGVSNRARTKKATRVKEAIKIFVLEEPGLSQNQPSTIVDQACQTEWTRRHHHILHVKQSQKQKKQNKRKLLIYRVDVALASES
eukprot:GHVT01095580.1.p1 GENE.GHVT01095580.1~~GHVT01095580.1.p1  ORF type:complete len:123 (-),score=11.05 GHVT01095580.1:2011-2379(-)